MMGGKKKPGNERQNNQKKITKKNKLDQISQDSKELFGKFR